MKKLMVAAMLLLCVSSVYAQRAEFGVKLGGFANYDPAFNNAIVPMTGGSLLFQLGKSPLQLGAVAELGLDGSGAVLGIGTDLNYVLKIGKHIRVYPGIDMRLMTAYSDAALGLGSHAGITYRLNSRVNLNAEAGPRVLWFNASPGYNYIVGTGTVGLRFAL